MPEFQNASLLDGLQRTYLQQVSEIVEESETAYAQSREAWEEEVRKRKEQAMVSMIAEMGTLIVGGIQEPIKYVEYDGQMYVVDGHHRLLAAKRLGLTKVSIERVELPYVGYSTIDDLLWLD